MVVGPDEYLRSVVFLCVDTTEDGVDKRVPKSTGFLVRVPVEGKAGQGADYVVTARHCLERAREYKTLFARLNTTASGIVEIPTDVDDWMVHDTADVAAVLVLGSQLPEGMQSSDLDQVSVGLVAFVGPPPEYRLIGESDEVGSVNIPVRVGHEIFVLGLFSEHYGEERNLPVARFGHIARMPSELAVESGGTHSKIVAYLAELLSWGGQSGSPAFFLHPFVRETEVVDGDGRVTKTVYDHVHAIGLIGVVSGHYPIKQDADTTGDEWSTVKVDLNSGIAMITPASAVVELLMRDDVKSHRVEVLSQPDS